MIEAEAETHRGTPAPACPPDGFYQSGRRMFSRHLWKPMIGFRFAATLHRGFFIGTRDITKRSFGLAQPLRTPCENLIKTQALAVTALTMTSVKGSF